MGLVTCTHRWDHTHAGRGVRVAIASGFVDIHACPAATLLNCTLHVLCSAILSTCSACATLCSVWEFAPFLSTVVYMPSLCGWLPADPLKPLLTPHPKPQVAALKMGQQLLEATKNQEGAQNRNYVARKEEELSGRIQAAESDAQQHHLVLTWGLD